MHSDEYGITLSREVHICKAKLKEIRQALAALEDKYACTTGAFVAGEGPAGVIGDKDAAVWKENSEALKTWTSRQEQYDEIYRTMR